MMEWIWIVVGLLLISLVGGYVAYRRSRKVAPPAHAPRVPVSPEEEDLGTRLSDFLSGIVAPQYVSGGANYMITLGIGTPAEISAFILFGLATTGPVTVTNIKSGHKSGYPFRGFY